MIKKQIEKYMTSKKGKPISKEQFDTLIKFDGWKVYDVPKSDWRILPSFIDSEKTIAIIASGSWNYENIQTLNGFSDVIAAFDWLRYEPEEKRKNGEKPGNANHFIITKESNNEYSFYGPFNDDIPINHWFDDDDLSEYIDRIE